MLIQMLASTNKIRLLCHDANKLFKFFFNTAPKQREGATHIDSEVVAVERSRTGLHCPQNDHNPK